MNHTRFVSRNPTFPLCADNGENTTPCQAVVYVLRMWRLQVYLKLTDEGISIIT